MGDRTSYAPGTFSWVELATTDPDRAKSFYSGLFGWTHEDVPAGEAGVYTMAKLKGKDVAGLSGQREDERSQGIPPHWNSYVTVDDLAQRAADVAALGGTVIAPPFDVMDAGRMAVGADPTGAMFAMWEPKSNIGAGIVNEPGALCWNELATPDVEKASEFYSGLFGWATEDHGGQYTTIRNGELSNGGIRPQGEREQGIPPNWLVYFAVSGCDGAAAKAAELGGTVMVQPMDVPVGENSRIAVIADPQGAVFGIFSGHLDP